VKKHPVETVLRRATKGLLFPSETDAELEPFVWKRQGKELTGERLLDLAGQDEDAPVEEMTLDRFFRAVPSAERPRFDELARVLNEQLSGITVYKVGEVEKDVYIVGETDDGHWAGLRTAVVET